MDAIKNYMAVRPKDGLKEKDKDALFLSSRLQRISPKTVQHMFMSIWTKRVSATEVFRHISFAIPPQLLCTSTGMLMYWY